MERRRRSGPTELTVGYGDEQQAKDGESIQEDNTHSTGVASEQIEEKNGVG